VRLPRIVGQGHAMDMILTGRPVHADEALRIDQQRRAATSVEDKVRLTEELAALFRRGTCPPTS